jgi:site-specific recombinase XerD
MQVGEAVMSVGSNVMPSGAQTRERGSRSPKLLDQLRETLRSRHSSRCTEQTYCHWVKRYIFFHKVRHPIEMAEPEINAFLTYLAVQEKVSASTQNQALSALLFLYRHVLKRDIGDLGEVIRARKPTRLPVVLTRDEVKAIDDESFRRQVADCVPDLWCRIAADGMPEASSARHRFLAQ